MHLSWGVQAHKIHNHHTVVILQWPMRLHCKVMGAESNFHNLDGRAPPAKPSIGTVIAGEPNNIDIHRRQSIVINPCQLSVRRTSYNWSNDPAELALHSQYAIRHKTNVKLFSCGIPRGYLNGACDWTPSKWRHKWLYSSLAPGISLLSRHASRYSTNIIVHSSNHDSDRSIKFESVFFITILVFLSIYKHLYRPLRLI